MLPDMEFNGSAMGSVALAVAAAVSGNGSWPWSPGKLVIRQVQRLLAVLPSAHTPLLWTNELHVAIDAHTNFSILLILFVLVDIFSSLSL